jgi:serine phosphatase RsbU (regulator of sigma subunit)
MLLYVAAGWSPAFGRRSGWLSALGWGLVISMGAVTLVQLFAILAAGLYTQDGPGVYFAFLTGLLLVSWLAHRLSMYIERSQQRSRELARLEQLGRAILDAPPDASTLPELLAEHAANMFSNSHLEIHLFPDRTLLHHPDDWPPVSGLAWEWLQANPKAHHFLPGTTFPWDRSQDHDAAVVLAPILDAKSRGGAQPASIGGIFLSRRLDAGDVTSLVPAVHSLAAQIASALHRAEVYRIESDLAVAGQIQASFLPEGVPQIPGWQLAASLEPARETSGDFYDVIPLPNGRWGIVVADVADKGTGAALYMALSRTLIRTYAVEHDSQPALVFRAANRRILADARAYLFVTVFYGILDPATGMLAYCNAGHNPPYLLSGFTGDAIQTLPRTGLPLGILEEGTWDQRTAQLSPGSTLVVYSDGIPEAQDPRGDFFGQERLLKLLQAHRGSSAEALQDVVLATVHQFTGQTSPAPHDDITLVIVGRDLIQDRPAATGRSPAPAADAEHPPSL